MITMPSYRPIQFLGSHTLMTAQSAGAGLQTLLQEKGLKAFVLPIESRTQKHHFQLGVCLSHPDTPAQLNVLLKQLESEGLVTPKGEGYQFRGFSLQLPTTTEVEGCSNSSDRFEKRSL